MSELKTIIDANIKENGNQEITGKTMNYVLNKIAEGTEKDWNESDATKGGYIKGRTHGVTYELVSVEGTLKELGYVPGEYVSVLHYARVNGVLEGKGLYLGGLLYNPIVGEEYEVKYAGPSVYAKVVEVEDGYDVQIKGASDTGNILKVAIVGYKTIDDAYISTDIARKSQVDALEQKVDNLPQGEEFDKQGNYPLLHVGTADDLAGRGESVPAEFGFRASGGKSIKDGRAYIKRIKGNSVVWNQLFYNGDFSLGNKNWNIMNNNSFTVDDGVATIKLESEPQNDYWAYIVMNTSQFQQKRIVGHRYLFMCSVWLTKTAPFIISSAGTTPLTSNTFNSVPTNTWVTYGAIAEATEERSATFAAYPRQKVSGYVAGDIWKIKGYKTIDLTQMFGSGNEPTTIEDFNARVATLGVDMNAYNEGQVIHCNTESIKSVGDNAWDEEWRNGHYVSTTGVYNNSSQSVCNVNPIKVLPNQEYYNTRAADEYIEAYAFFYDADMNFISYASMGRGTFTTPANSAYMNFYFSASYYGTTYKNDIMITLVHSGWKQDTDAGYQPYWQDTLPLPIIRKYFPQGMKSAGSAHDEIRYNKASGKWEKVVRIGEDNMWELDWGYAESNAMFYFGGGSKYFRYMGILTTEYPNVESSAIPKRIYAVTDILRLFDPSYTDVETFKAMLQEKQMKLYYELAEPIVTELDAEDQNFRDYYNVADFGTEQSQSSVPSAPFSADIIYQFNAVDMIREHELEITELQKVIATMQTQLASLTSPTKL